MPEGSYQLQKSLNLIKKSRQLFEYESRLGQILQEFSSLSGLKSRLRQEGW
jgi:hypothetical protein